MLIDEVKALIFDVFGTVVDWRGSITREGEMLGRRKEVTHVDWAEFADAWRGGLWPIDGTCEKGRAPLDPDRRPPPHDSRRAFWIDSRSPASPRTRRSISTRRGTGSTPGPTLHPVFSD